MSSRPIHSPPDAQATPTDGAAPESTASEDPTATTAAAETTATTSEAETTASATPAKTADDAAPGRATTDWPALGRLLAPVKGRMIVAALISLVAVAVRLVPAVAVAEIALHRQELTPGFLYGWLAAGAVGLVLGQLMHGGVLVRCHEMEADFRRDLRIELASRLARVPLGWYTSRNSGTVKKVLREDVAAVHSIVAHLPADGTAAVGLPVLGLALLFHYDWRFALGILLWVVLIGMLTSALSPGNMKESTEKYMSAQAGMSQALVELVRGITVVKNYGGSGRVFDRYERALQHFITWTGNWMRANGRSQSVALALFNPAGMILPTVLLGWALIGWFDAYPGLLVPFLVIGLMLPVGPANLMPLMRFLVLGAEAAGRLAEVLDTEPLEVPEDPTPIPDGPLGVSFRDVTFGYDPEHPVLRGLDAEFPAGTVTALVGPSGSGKTTVTRLAARFHDVDSGSVRLGGVDLREADDADVLAHLAIVEQDVTLIHGIAAENIALGRPGADRAEIEAAARAARIHDRIMALPRGYDTVLGGDEAHLSGGERQRVALARAFLRDAPVLLLDEATAWADPHSEREIQEALAELAAGRTVIVVAHRLATVVGADRILVLDDGQVVEEGRHEELAEAGGLYATLWEAQR